MTPRGEGPTADIRDPVRERRMRLCKLGVAVLIAAVLVEVALLMHWGVFR